MSDEAEPWPCPPARIQIGYWDLPMIRRLKAVNRLFKSDLDKIASEMRGPREECDLILWRNL